MGQLPEAAGAADSKDSGDGRCSNSSSRHATSLCNRLPHNMSRQGSMREHLILLEFCATEHSVNTSNINSIWNQCDGMCVYECLPSWRHYTAASASRGGPECLTHPTRHLQLPSPDPQHSRCCRGSSGCSNEAGPAVGTRGAVPGRHCCHGSRHCYRVGCGLVCC